MGVEAPDKLARKTLKPAQLLLDSTMDEPSWLSSRTEGVQAKVLQAKALLDESGDSFGEKAELFYKKRPQLLMLLEDISNSYRSLADRYEHLTTKIRKKMPKNLQVQYGIDVDASPMPSPLPSSVATPPPPSLTTSPPQPKGLVYRTVSALAASSPRFFDRLITPEERTLSFAAANGNSNGNGNGNGVGASPGVGLSAVLAPVTPTVYVSETAAATPPTPQSGEADNWPTGRTAPLMQPVQRKGGEAVARLKKWLTDGATNGGPNDKEGHRESDNGESRGADIPCESEARSCVESKEKACEGGGALANGWMSVPEAAPGDVDGLQRENQGLRIAVLQLQQDVGDLVEQKLGAIRELSMSLSIEREKKEGLEFQVARARQLIMEGGVEARPRGLTGALLCCSLPIFQSGGSTAR